MRESDGKQRNRDCNEEGKKRKKTYFMAWPVVITQNFFLILKKGLLKRIPPDSL